MSPAEKRQAKRIIRNAKAAEAAIFQLIDELSPPPLEGMEPFDWDSIKRRLTAAQNHLSIAIDLAKNIQTEVENP